MSNMLHRSGIALAASGLAVCVASTVRAGVVALTRNSSIVTQGQVLTDDFTSNQSTDQFGTFDKSFVKTGGDAQGTHGDLNISQNATVNQSNGVLSGSGSLTAHAFGQFSNPNDVSGPLAIRGDNNLAVTFQVVGGPELLKVHGDFQQTDLLGADTHLILTQVSPPPQSQQLLKVFQNDDESPLAFDDSFSLAEGTYKIAVDAAAGSSGSSRGDQFSSGEDTGITFNFSVGHGTSAIPLPAGVWTGAVGLVLVGVLDLSRRRKRRGLLLG